MSDQLPPKVAILKCDSYDPSLLDEKVEQIFSLLEDTGQIVRPGMKVLLKPNMISAKAPELAITTHPEIVAAVARKVRSMGGIVAVGDSPGGAKRGINRVWENTGMKAMAEREGLELINFEAGGVEKFQLNGRAYYLAKPAVEADLVINLPKLKTHVLTLMTGAVKNVYGLIPGFRKGNYHKEYPKPKDFAEIVVDILSIITPGLTIMDSILAMEGDGPSSGKPRWANLIMASRDPVALDAVAGEIIGLKSYQVPTTRIASEAGLGIGWAEMVEIRGERFSDVRINDFELTSNRKFELIPELIWRVIGPFVWVRPAIDNKKCTKCQTCLNSCPTGALRLGENKVPLFNYDLCINCWCCHELCPSKSVYVNKSWLAEKFIR